MLFSYVMGVDKTIYELEEYGFVIQEDGEDFMVSFPSDRSEIWENFIKSKLKIGFWNEYISNQSTEIVFNFHLEDGIKRFVVNDFDNKEVLNLCENLCGCKFVSIEKMIRGNHFYNQILNLKEMVGFLINAKKNTYANGDSLKVESSRFGSKDYHYEEFVGEQKMVYHDTYFGGEKFFGEEVVYVNDEPFWAMNYNGYSVVSNLSEEAMDSALRPALMLVGEDESILPVRGPSEYINGEYKYIFEVTGKLENFTGIERIYKNEVLIYELKCSGGTIK